jgi:3-dehydroquinate synthase
MVQRDVMPSFEVRTPGHTYQTIVERRAVQRLGELIPSHCGTVFVVTTEDVWQLHGDKLSARLNGYAFHVLFFPGGEVNKRLAQVEVLAEQMVERGADRSSLVIGFGGGIITDVSGFLAAIFMRGLPVIQVPTTLLAQVDAATGGKTGVNLRSGKNLIGSFHQPRGVLIDLDVLATLPSREYRAGLFEVIKCGIIRDPALFDLLELQSEAVLAMRPHILEQIVSASVRIKCEVVSEDEREGDLRRILNFGHTVGHAIEAETQYIRFLHGEAIGWGMLVATRLARLAGTLSEADTQRISETVCRYGPLPPAGDLEPGRLIRRLESDKKTVQGRVHFVLPERIGSVKVVSDIPPEMIGRAIQAVLQ